MDKKILTDYMLAKRGRKHMPVVLHTAIKENEALNNKFLKLLDKNPSLDVLAEKLKVQGLAIEILAKANKLQLVYTTTGTYITK